MAHFIDRRLNGKNKSAVNRQRFLHRYKEQIKKAVSLLEKAIIHGAPLLASWHTTAMRNLPSKELSRQVKLSRLSEKAHCLLLLG